MKRNISCEACKSNNLFDYISQYQNNISIFYVCIFIFLIFKAGLLIGIYNHIENTDSLDLNRINKTLRVPDSGGYIDKIEKITILFSLADDEQLQYIKSQPRVFRKIIDSQPYVVFIAKIASLISVNSIYIAIVINCLAISLVSVLFRMICIDIYQSIKFANLMALLVILWPPTLLITFAIMRDLLTYLFIFLILFSVIKLIKVIQKNALRKYKWIGFLSLMVLLFIGINMLISLRHYMQNILILFLILCGSLVLICDRKRLYLNQSLLLIVVVLSGVAISSYSSEYSIMVGMINSDIRETIEIESANTRKFAKKINSINSNVESLIVNSNAVPEKSFLDKAFIKIENFFYHPLKSMRYHRKRFVISKGYSNNQEKRITIESFSKGMFNLVFFPFPWEDWPKKHSNQTLQIIVKIFSVLWYLFLVGLVWGCIESVFSQNRLHPLIIILWSACIVVPMVCVITNYGTLFRLRDFALFPLLIIWSPKPYLLFGNWFRNKIAAI